MSYRVLASRVAVLACAATLVMCSSTEAPQSGGLMVEVINDGTLSVDLLAVTVKRQDGTLAIDGHYDNPQLPNTIGIANEHANASAEVAISAFRKGGEPVERRDYSLRNIPTDRVVGLRVVLSGGCTPHVSKGAAGEARSDCAAGTTCNPLTGTCVISTIDASTLPAYEPGDETNVVEKSDAGPKSDSGPTKSDSSVTDAATDAPSSSCAIDQKTCGGTCVPADAAHGCKGTSCDACQGGLAGSAACDAAGACTLLCNDGYKLCGGSCVTISDPKYGCGKTSCDDSACPNAGGGTLVCDGDTCKVDTCPADKKNCNGACVPTDVTHGCQDAARCTTCAANESCVGAPSTCQCVPEAKATTCAVTPCGVAKNNCNQDVDCGSCVCVGVGSQVCGNCGTQTRTCNSGTWTAWSSCSGEGVCAPSVSQACAYGQTSCTVCTSGCAFAPGITSYCGDTKVDATNGEQCDKGASNGLTACTYGQTSCNVCSVSCVQSAGTTSYCGDGKIDSANGEKCDDGNGNSNDGCSSACKVEAGYACVGTPSVCTKPSECSTGRQLRNPVAITDATVTGFWLTTGDVDKDGKVDLVMSTNASLTVMRGNGDGTFKAPVAFSTTGNTYPSLADVDGDGLPEILAGGGGAIITVHHNLGGGNFAAPVQIPAHVTVGGTLGFAVGDVDNDGKVDAVAGSDSWSSGDKGEVLFGLTIGGASASHTLYAYGASKIWSTVVADLDHVGGLDVVFDEFSYSLGGLTVVLSSGSGLGTPTKYAFSSATYPIVVRAGDVNGDGWNDLVAGDWATGAVSVLTNQKNGTFGAIATTGLSFSSCNTSNGCLWDVALPDLNADGKADIVVPGINDNRLSVLLSNAGAFASVTETYTVGASGNQPQGVTAADVNQDGKPDVIVMSTNGPAQLFLHCP